MSVAFLTLQLRLYQLEMLYCKWNQILERLKKWAQRTKTHTHTHERNDWSNIKLKTIEQRENRLKQKWNGKRKIKIKTKLWRIGLWKIWWSFDSSGIKIRDENKYVLSTIFKTQIRENAKFKNVLSTRCVQYLCILYKYGCSLCDISSGRSWKVFVANGWGGSVVYQLYYQKNSRFFYFISLNFFFFFCLLPL